MPTSKPSFETILALAKGELCGAEADAAKAAIDADSCCRRQFSEISQTLAQLQSNRQNTPPADWIARAKAAFAPRAAEPRRSWIEQVVTAMARLVYDSRVQPALAGFRGEAEGATLTYECDGATMDLHLIAAEKDAWTVLGQVDAAASEGHERIAFVRHGTSEIVAEADADESGQFRVSLAGGEYDVFCELTSELLKLDTVRIGD